MNRLSRKWLRRIAVIAVVLLAAALLGVFTPARRDARLTFLLRPGGSVLCLTPPAGCRLTGLKRLPGAGSPEGSLAAAAANGWSAVLPLNAPEPEWRELERALQALPPECAWTLQGRNLPPEQEEVKIEITLNGPAETVREEWHSWVRLLPSAAPVPEKTGEDSVSGD